MEFMWSQMLQAPKFTCEPWPWADATANWVSLEYQKFYARVVVSWCALFPHGNSLSELSLARVHLLINMRFLCLHGMGTNADIFESQLGKEPPCATSFTTDLLI